MRAALKSFEFGEYTLTVDCDVMQADGGTRTASITGASVAVAEACSWMERELGVLNPFDKLVAAISVGIVSDEVLLDLAYAEDKNAQVDANIVVAEPDTYVEVQGSAEGRPFNRAELDRLLQLAQVGTTSLFEAQRKALGS